MSSNSLIVYLLGALLLIAGIGYGCYLAHMPVKWITMLVIVMLGFAVLALSRKMSRPGPPSGPGAPKV
jgi:hypothetical protein